jgi:WD40 repeat protein
LKVQFPNVKVRDSSYGYATTWGKFVKRGFVAADFSPDGKLLAVAQGGETDTGQVHLIDTTSGKLVRTVCGHRYGATDVRFSDDGNFVLSTGRDTMLRICQVGDGKQVAELGQSCGGQFKDWLSSLAISPDGKRLAATDIAGIVHVWSVD